MHKGLDQLEKELANAQKFVVVGSVYSHYKSPDKGYIVNGFVVTEVDDEVCVSYSPEDRRGVVFVRPLKSWLETVDGKPRFYLKNRGK